MISAEVEGGDGIEIMIAIGNPKQKVEGMDYTKYFGLWRLGSSLGIT